MLLPKHQGLLCWGQLRPGHGRDHPGPLLAAAVVLAVPDLIAAVAAFRRTVDTVEHLRDTGGAGSRLSPWPAAVAPSMTVGVTELPNPELAAAQTAASVS